MGGQGTFGGGDEFRVGTQPVPWDEIASQFQLMVGAATPSATPRDAAVARRAAPGSGGSSDGGGGELKWPTTSVLAPVCRKVVTWPGGDDDDDDSSDEEDLSDQLYLDQHDRMLAAMKNRLEILKRNLKKQAPVSGRRRGRVDPRAPAAGSPLAGAGGEVPQSPVELEEVPALSRDPSWTHRAATCPLPEREGAVSGRV